MSNAHETTSSFQQTSHRVLAEGSSSVSGMPRACPVEAHDSSYTRGGPTPPFLPRFARGGCKPPRAKRGRREWPRVCVARNVRIPRTSRGHSPVAARTTANCWRNITEKLPRRLHTCRGASLSRSRPRISRGGGDAIHRSAEFAHGSGRRDVSFGRAVATAGVGDGGPGLRVLPSPASRSGDTVGNRVRGFGSNGPSRR